MVFVDCCFKVLFTWLVCVCVCVHALAFFRLGRCVCRADCSRLLLESHDGINEFCSKPSRLQIMQFGPNLIKGPHAPGEELTRPFGHITSHQPEAAAADDVIISYMSTCLTCSFLYLLFYFDFSRFYLKFIIYYRVWTLYATNVAKINDGNSHTNNSVLKLNAICWNVLNIISLALIIFG